MEVGWGRFGGRFAPLHSWEPRPRVLKHVLKSERDNNVMTELLRLSVAFLAQFAKTLSQARLHEGLTSPSLVLCTHQISWTYLFEIKNIVNNTVST